MNQTDRPPFERTVAELQKAVADAAARTGVSVTDVLTALVAAGADGDIVAPAPTHSDAVALTAELGPYLTGAAIQRRAGGITRQAIHSRRKKWALIGVPTDRHRHLFPVRQFADAAAAIVLRGVQDAASIIAASIDDELTVATWLARPNPDLGGVSAYEWLRNELNPVGAVLSAAHRDAARWRG